MVVDTCTFTDFCFLNITGTATVKSSTFTQSYLFNGLATTTITQSQFNLNSEVHNDKTLKITTSDFTTSTLSGTGASSTTAGSTSFSAGSNINTDGTLTLTTTTHSSSTVNVVDTASAAYSTFTKSAWTSLSSTTLSQTTHTDSAVSITSGPATLTSVTVSGAKTTFTNLSPSQITSSTFDSIFSSNSVVSTTDLNNLGELDVTKGGSFTSTGHSYSVTTAVLADGSTWSATNTTISVTSLQVGSGVLGGTGTFSLGASSSLDVTQSLTLSTCKVENSGSITFEDSSASSQCLTIDAMAGLLNYGSLKFSSSCQVGSTGGGTLWNYGTLELHGIQTILPDINLSPSSILSFAAHNQTIYTNVTTGPVVNIGGTLLFKMDSSLVGGLYHLFTFPSAHPTSVGWKFSSVNVTYVDLKSGAEKSSSGVLDYTKTIELPLIVNSAVPLMAFLALPIVLVFTFFF
uniref:Uncharacterized protein n=1 Tax=Arcella intermedia TaxID=1963864 RepID=A0A6B2L1T3_9EUKA